jgi:hypothetical protein
MPTHTKVLSAKRAYEFGVDAIRLTALSSHAVLQLLQQTFSFQQVAITSPPETFGPVAATNPPGIVCQLGYLQSTQDLVVPIRAIIIEPRRIVIDIAAPSSFVDSVYERFNEVLATVMSADGEPILSGQPTQKDYSELSAKLDLTLDQFFHPAVYSLLKAASDCESDGLVLPRIQLSCSTLGATYAGDAGAATALQLSLRVGSKWEDKTFFSAAMLDSSRHEKYLADLERVLRAGA